MDNKTITQLAKDLRDKKYSSVELTQNYLARIQKYKKLNCYISVTSEHALKTAKIADIKLSKGNNNLLTGIPIAQKDIFCTQGIKTSCGSKMLDNFISPYSATIVENFNNTDAVMLGKLNMDEFAMGSSNETSFYGPVQNPWDTSAVPGGSSGGSASAVASNLAVAATGTDTGGSIRQPASLCGITGLKPTYGRISRYGMVAFSSSLDQAGPMTRSAEDAAILLQTMAGFDIKDSTSVNHPVPDYSINLNDSIHGLKIGIPKEFFGADLNDDIAKTIETAIAEYKKMGAEVQEVSLPNMHLSIPAYYVIAPAECSANLSRYDGVRFGYRCDNPVDINDLYIRSRGEAFGAEVKRRILIGTYVLSAGYYDDYYVKAQKIRRLIAEDFSKVFSQVDVLMGAVSPSTAFALNEKISDPITMYLADIYTIAVNLAGLPAISIPAGFVANKPVGLQIISNYFTEAKLLNISHKYQQITNWHQQTPPGFG